MYKLKKLLIRLKTTFNVIRLAWRDGGFKEVKIAHVSHGNILKGKRVLITGGGSGIGLAITKKCLSEGAQVLITGRSAVKLDKVRMSLNDKNLSTLQWDIAEVSSVDEKLIQATEKLKGKIDILINNAGILHGNPFPNTSESDWDITYATNSKGLYFLTQALCKFWINQGKQAKVINISSTGGFLAAKDVYRMTKWDVAGFTQALGLDMAPHGIIVNGIAPGRTATEMLCVDPTENLHDTHQPLCRYAHPDEIAEICLFLLSDAANYIVGQTIICDGGYTLKA